MVMSSSTKEKVLVKGDLELRAYSFRFRFDEESRDIEVRGESNQAMLLIMSHLMDRFKKQGIDLDNKDHTLGFREVSIDITVNIRPPREDDPSYVIETINNLGSRLLGNEDLFTLAVLVNKVFMDNTARN